MSELKLLRYLALGLLCLSACKTRQRLPLTQATRPANLQDTAIDPCSLSLADEIKAPPTTNLDQKQLDAFRLTMSVSSIFKDGQYNPLIEVESSSLAYSAREERLPDFPQIQICTAKLCVGAKRHKLVARGSNTSAIAFPEWSGVIALPSGIMPGETLFIRARACAYERDYSEAFPVIKATRCAQKWSGAQVLYYEGSKDERIRKANAYIEAQDAKFAAAVEAARPAAERYLLAMGRPSSDDPKEVASYLQAYAIARDHKGTAAALAKNMLRSEDIIADAKAAEDTSGLELAGDKHPCSGDPISSPAESEKPDVDYAVVDDMTGDVSPPKAPPAPDPEIVEKVVTKEVENIIMEPGPIFQRQISFVFPNADPKAERDCLILKQQLSGEIDLIRAKCPSSSEKTWNIQSLGGDFVHIKPAQFPVCLTREENGSLSASQCTATEQDQRWLWNEVGGLIKIKAVDIAYLKAKDNAERLAATLGCLKVNAENTGSSLVPCEAADAFQIARQATPTQYTEARAMLGSNLRLTVNGQCVESVRGSSTSELSFKLIKCDGAENNEAAKYNFRDVTVGGIKADKVENIGFRGCWRHSDASLGLSDCIATDEDQLWIRKQNGKASDSFTAFNLIAVDSRWAEATNSERSQYELGCVTVDESMLSFSTSTANCASFGILEDPQYDTLFLHFSKKSLKRDIYGAILIALAAIPILYRAGVQEVKRFRKKRGTLMSVGKNYFKRPKDSGDLRPKELKRKSKVAKLGDIKVEEVGIEDGKKVYKYQAAEDRISYEQVRDKLIATKKDPSKLQYDLDGDGKISLADWNKLSPTTEDVVRIKGKRGRWSPLGAEYLVKRSDVFEFEAAVRTEKPGLAFKDEAGHLRSASVAGATIFATSLILAGVGLANAQNKLDDEDAQSLFLADDPRGDLRSKLAAIERSKHDHDAALARVRSLLSP